jgi:hypothetical protein
MIALDIPTATPTPMDHHERSRVRRAAWLGTKLYPGPVGELIGRELLGWEELGYRLGEWGPAWRLIEFLEAEERRRAEGQAQGTPLDTQGDLTQNK